MKKTIEYPLRGFTRIVSTSRDVTPWKTLGWYSSSSTFMPLFLLSSRVLLLESPAPGHFPRHPATCRGRHTGSLRFRSDGNNAWNEPVYTSCPGNGCRTCASIFLVAFTSRTLYRTEHHIFRWSLRTQLSSWTGHVSSCSFKGFFKLRSTKRIYISLNTTCVSSISL